MSSNFNKNLPVSGKITSLKSVEAPSGNFTSSLRVENYQVHKASVYCGHNDNNPITVNNTIQVVPIRGEFVIDSIYSRSSDEVTVLASGIYKGTSEIVVERQSNAGGPRGAPRSTIQLNGFSILPAFSQGYIREAANNLSDTLTITLIGPLSSGDTLRHTITDLVTNEPDEAVIAYGARFLLERIR